MKSTFRLEQCMRWYGPQDPVSLQDISQAGCSGVVTALHQIPVGDVWTPAAIAERKKLITDAGLSWSVVESLPVHEEIKTWSGAVDTHLEIYKESLRNLAAQGIRVVTYNFMPVLDWIRTNTSFRLPNGAETLRFDRLDFIAFDLYMLKRPGAQADYSQEEKEQALTHFYTISATDRQRIFKNSLLGLPGSDVPFTAPEVLQLLESYQHIDRQQLQQHLYEFLRAITPTAEEVGIQLAIHPDDPPYAVLGLPRIMNTSDDIKALLEAVPSVANGLCFCSGSYGARSDNDVPQMLKQWGNRIYFLHLRNTQLDNKGNFMEANHLGGDTDMYQLMTEIVRIMQKEGRSIPMRPDHGFKILDDLQKSTYPGYSAIGRLKGLAELRGLEYAIQRILH